MARRRHFAAIAALAGITAPVSAQEPLPREIPRPVDFVTGQDDNLFSLRRSQEDIHEWELALAEIDAGKLPAVSFYKPVGKLTQHPSYTDLAQGDAHLDELLQRLTRSPLWPKMAVIVTYDENGGYWDHLPPPKGDRWGPGTRIPALVISPFAKKGYVDKTPYDTTSIIKLITRRYGLEPLPGARPGAGDLSNAFAF